MKKKELETLEKLNKERKLDSETKERILKKTFKNIILGTIILLLYIVLMLIAIKLDKNVATLIYKEISIGMLIITLFLFEVAYKKDNDELAITSIEMFFLTIFVLLTPYTLISKANANALFVGIYFTIYYAIKNLIIYSNAKKEYLSEKNDISEIIKRESQDKLAQEQLEKTRKEKQEKIIRKTTKTTSKREKKIDNTKQNDAPKKRGRPRKNKDIETKTEIQETKEVEPPKRKRGRPQKVKSE